MILSTIASLIEGTLIGDPNCVIDGVASLEDAKPGDISFILEKSYINHSHNNPATAFVTFKQLDHLENQIIVKNPRKALADVLKLFVNTTHPVTSQSPHAIISPLAQVAASVRIHHFTVIEDHVSIGDDTIIYNNVSIGRSSSIGKRCIIYPNVTLYDNVTIGDDVIIHSGTVIGSDGFGFHLHEGKFHKVPQIGKVIIGNDVEIQANSVVDRGTIGNTVIGENSKLDNLVHIAHNTTIGKHTVIAAQVGCTGKSKIGSYVSIGGQVGIDSTEIEDQVMIAGKSGVTKRIPKGSIVSGNPAMDHKKALKKEAFIRKLCEKEGIL